MILEAVDPGVRGFGWARFDVTAACPLPERGERSVLTACGYSFVDAPPRAERPDLLVIEVPQVDGRTRAVRLKDFSALSFAAGRIEGRTAARDVRRVFPREWKGNTPKKVTQTRARAALSVGELVTLELGLRGVGVTLRHNTLDAVGIGLWYLGRYT